MTAATVRKETQMHNVRDAVAYHVFVNLRNLSSTFRNDSVTRARVARHNAVSDNGVGRTVPGARLRPPGRAIVTQSGRRAFDCF